MDAELTLFAARLRHDLVGTLNRMSLLGEMIERRCASQAGEDQSLKDLFSHFGSARSKAEALSRAVDQYLKVTCAPLSIARIPGSRALDLALAGLKDRIENSGAVVKAGQMPTVSADEGLLATMFTEIIDNAITFRRENAGVEINISTVQNGDQVLFRFADNGAGVDPTLIDRVFEPFRRGPKGGAGLGLATAAVIAHRHGGSIRMESVPGEGSTVFISL